MTTLLERFGEELQALQDELLMLRDNEKSLQRTFDLRWEADMRAIKRWQAAHPGNDMTWPDHADLVVWLMEQLEKQDAGASL